MPSESWSAFLPMVPPTVTHNDLEPYRRRDGSLGIRKSESLHAAEDAYVARVMAAGPPDVPLGSGGAPLRMTVAWCFPCEGGHEQGSPHTSKPDMSNMLKTLEDVLQRCRVIADDSRIADEHTSKAWSDPAGVYVRVEEFGGDGN